MKLLYSKTFKNYLCMMLTLMCAEILFRVVSGITLFDYALLRILLGVNIISLILTPLGFMSGVFCSVNVGVQKNGHIKCDNFQQRKQIMVWL